MISYYQRLGVTATDSMATIRKQYYRLAKECHPDKYQGDPRESQKCEDFKHLSEAYSALSNPRKRYLYDIRYVLHEMSGSDLFPESLLYHFSDEDLELLHSYYEKLTTSTEFRLIQTLASSLPGHGLLTIKEVLEKLRTAWYQVGQDDDEGDEDEGEDEDEGDEGDEGDLHRMELLPITHRTIRCLELYEDYEITLKRPFHEVYHNQCKEIQIQSLSGIYHVYVTHSDYSISFKNGNHQLTLHLVTDVPEHLTLNGPDIYYEYPIDLYQYFFESEATIAMPSGLLYPAPIRARETLLKQGLRLMDVKHRGRLTLVPIIGLSLDMQIAHLHRELLKTIFTTDHSSTKFFNTDGTTYATG